MSSHRTPTLLPKRSRAEMGAPPQGRAGRLCRGEASFLQILVYFLRPSLPLDRVVGVERLRITSDTPFEVCFHGYGEQDWDDISQELDDHFEERSLLCLGYYDNGDTIPFVQVLGHVNGRWIAGSIADEMGNTAARLPDNQNVTLGEFLQQMEGGLLPDPHMLLICYQPA